MKFFELKFIAYNSIKCRFEDGTNKRETEIKTPKKQTTNTDCEHTILSLMIECERFIASLSHMYNNNRQPTTANRFWQQQERERDARRTDFLSN